MKRTDPAPERPTLRQLAARTTAPDLARVLSDDLAHSVATASFNSSI